jgi:hypothetical protein
MSQNEHKDIFSGNLGLAAVIVAVIMAATAGIVFFAFGEDNYIPTMNHKDNPCYLFEGNDITIMSNAPWCQSWLDLQLGYGWSITSTDNSQIYLIKPIIG